MGKKVKDTSTTTKKITQPGGNVRHRTLKGRGKSKTFTISRAQAKRLALRAGEPHIKLKKGIPAFLTVLVHHATQTVGTAARHIADCRKLHATVKSSDMSRAIYVMFRQRMISDGFLDLRDQKRARKHRAARLLREQEAKKKKNDAQASDAATSDAGNA
jgi:hypothetical protein